MPTTSQKADILARAGIVVPACPAQPALSSPVQDQGHSEAAEAQRGDPVAQWNRRIDDLFAAYAMSRAARSLRESEEARQRSQLRNSHAQWGQDDPGAHGDLD